ncbi:hypothetical protein LshimejAT787_0407440 [Lyophyllum shimeji]|uniref:Uncharacterized protein n=1 Tax=Lyophyllum shimeji TaxID=47721 RepID=A0A9P3PKQ3_LYOSH|nr:hypothetical protein LshimejAT787_0407440 [Lyophyllum shimeji]
MLLESSTRCLTVPDELNYSETKRTNQSVHVCSSPRSHSDSGWIFNQPCSLNQSLPTSVDFRRFDLVNLKRPRSRAPSRPLVRSHLEMNFHGRSSHQWATSILHFMYTDV